LKKEISHINPRIKQKIKKVSKYNDKDTLYNGLINGERQAISLAITFVESTKQEDQQFISEVIQRAKIEKEAFVISVTGSPGVGKSTFINSFGQLIAKQSLKVGILATDPSSELSRGSILGDKTRMAELTPFDNIFIRPSASHNQLGGINSATVKMIDIFNIAGFDYIIIETVGVGQSEFSAYHLSDLFLLLVAPGGGDELQGIKRGIIEMADFICINKYDSAYKTTAEITLKQYSNSGRIIKNIRADWETKYMLVSGLENLGLEELWNAISAFEKERKASGHYELDKQRNKRKILSQQLDQIILESIKRNINTSQLIDQTLDSKDTKKEPFVSMIQYLTKQIEDKI